MTESGDVDQDSTDALSSWASDALSEMMMRHGVGSRHQAALVAQICAISVSQARRKFRGTPWLFNEVFQLCRHFNEALDTVFGATAPSTLEPGVMQTHDAPHIGTGSTYEARLHLGDQSLGCEIELGAQCALPANSASNGKLFAVHQPTHGWLVSDTAGMQASGASGPFFEVMHLQWRVPQAAARARIAVLDDDVGAAEGLSDWFNEVGYHAQAYNSTAQLLAQPLEDHDAFVVDLVLGPDETSEAVVERIRQALPNAPIVLLTGQLRDGTASEATLTTILRTQGVTFFEKPVRPAVLTAAIQSSLDRLATSHA
jgi:CheY-like chemotaxis protein